MKTSSRIRIILVLSLLTMTFSLPGYAQAEKSEALAFEEVRDFGFESLTQGWVFLDDHLFSTVDGGESWTDISPSVSIDAVMFNGQNGWVVLTQANEDGVAYSLAKTHNAGRGWNIQAIKLFSAQDSRISPKSIDIEFSDEQHGVIHIQHATSANFNIWSSFETNNGGATWTQTASARDVLPSSALVLDAHDEIIQRDMLTDSAGWSISISGVCSFTDQLTKAGADCTQKTRLQRTMDGGHHWELIPLPHTENGILEKRIIQPDSGSPIPELAFTQTWIGQGFDICEIPSLGKLKTWWDNSPYSAINLYIGGSARGCANVNLSSSFLVQLNQQGWKFIPTWVGPQAFCTGYSSRMSSNPATAYQQGVNEANSALTAAVQLGLTETERNGTIIYYDLEAYDTSNTACKTAANSFIQGWTDQMEGTGNISGMYGASCASALTDIGNLTNPPDAIWIANWIYSSYNSSATVFNTACLLNSYWPNHQRIRQYAGGHNESWGGATLNIDSNVIDGVVAIPAQGLVSDAFVNASMIPHSPYMDGQAIGAATTAVDDPVLPCAVGKGFNSIWYRFTPAVSERMLVSTSGSSYDTVLSVWTGSPGSLMNQACNNNFNGEQSEVQLDANAGINYFIEVTSSSAINSGTLILSVFQPAQDDFNGAKILTSKPASVIMNTSTTGFSNDDPNAPVCGLVAGSNSVWYQYTPTQSGPVSLDTFSSTYDTYLAVWSGSRGALTLVDCVDDTPAGQQSQMEVTLTGGTTYYIEVADFDGTLTAAPLPLGGGTLQLHLTTFFDVPGTYWAWPWIETLYANNITGGCETLTMLYCPETQVTRAQMAIFLERGIHGSAYEPSPATGAVFGDVPIDHWAGAWIEQLAADGVTGGCGSGDFCPEAPVTRAQMAVFLLRAKYGSAYVPPEVGAGTGFTDVPADHWTAPWIKQLAAENITGGCGTGIYCPNNPVTRAEMAIFLTRTFNLSAP